MKKIKYESTRNCSFCPARAAWRSSGLGLQKFACDDHRPELRKHEVEQADNGHMSEADHQTWGRL